MERIKGLREYVETKEFKASLGFTKDVDVKYELLAQGEYNINYIFTHPLTNEKLILRVNTASQMHLENQIQYEYDALKNLEVSGRTPRVYFVDGSKSKLDYGILVMEFLEGRALDYQNDMDIAAACLADIHSVRIGHNHNLISPKNPFEEIASECEAMFSVYKNSKLAEVSKVVKIERMLTLVNERMSNVESYEGYRCCINTELNSSNFLINGKDYDNYIIDWEKPLFADPAQDLGHFLAPTTTFWKTDVILEKVKIEKFINQYIHEVDNRFDVGNLEERVKLYIPANCLRGITWCAMAWTQYSEDSKLIINEDTFKKLEQYLDYKFLDMIECEFLI